MTGITDLPTAPQSTSPATFNAESDAFFLALQSTFVSEANAYGAFLAASAQGALAIPYLFSTTTTDSDPGVGNMRLNNATQTSSTVLRLDLADSNGVARAMLDAIGASTSAVKGWFGISAVGDSTKWIMGQVTAVASPAGYRNLTIQTVSGSSSSPFTNGMAVLFTFSPAGDIGVFSGPDIIVRDEKTSGTAPATSTGASYVKCALNTVVRNLNSLGSLASDAETLPAGTYYIRGRAAVSGNASKARLKLYNDSDAADIAIGSGFTCSNTSTAEARGEVGAVVTLASSKAISLRMWTSASVPMGLAVTSGDVEVYAILEIWKLA